MDDLEPLIDNLQPLPDEVDPIKFSLLMGEILAFFDEIGISTETRNEFLRLYAEHQKTLGKI